MAAAAMAAVPLARAIRRNRFRGRLGWEKLDFQSLFPEPDILFLKHNSRILKQSSNPVCGFSMMKQVRLCAVWPTENWPGSSMNHLQGRMTV